MSHPIAWHFAVLPLSPLINLVHFSGIAMLLVVFAAEH